VNKPAILIQIAKDGEYPGKEPSMRILVAIPVFNEEKYVRQVISRVLAHNPHVLIIDDGSTDQTPRILPDFPVDMIRHAVNRGYGKSLRDAFRFAIAEKYDWLITMDCDEQHEPAAIPSFIKAASETDADIISGSRYLLPTEGQDRPPPERRAINATMTAELNCRLSGALGTLLTDAFCGFKAYRVSSLRKLRPTVRGYAFPMQFWAQSAAAGLKVRELPVRLIYNDMNRTFGAQLDDPEVRLAHYRQVLHRELKRHAAKLPRAALAGVTEPHSADGCVEERRRPEAPVSESTRHQCSAAPRAATPQPKSGCCRR
jgi:glycosyltransferase involved in cell wall biosynthesis